MNTSPPRSVAPGHAAGCVYQVAFVVDDLEAAAKSWQRVGAGPFYAIHDFEFSNVSVPRGGQSPRMSILLGYSGTTMIELMKIDHDPHGHFAHVPPGGTHHVAIMVENLDTYLDKHQDAPTLFRAAFPTGTPLAFVDTRAQIGLITEVITRDAAVDAMQAEMYGAFLDFTGKDLIRSFG